MWDIRLKSFFRVLYVCYVFRKFDNPQATLIAYTVAQHKRNHLCDHSNLREAFYTSPVSQNLCAFLERKPALVPCNPCLYLEPGHVLSRGYLFPDLFMLSTRENLEPFDDNRPLL